MNKKIILKKVEAFVKKRMASVKDAAHDFNHVDRVRKLSLKIAKKERFNDLFLLEIAALLHDVGRNGKAKSDHYTAGEKIARRYLASLKVFTQKDIALVCRAVYGHGPGGKEKIVKILRDADRLDLLGAVGVARAFSYLHDRPYYLDSKSFTSGRWTSDKAIDRAHKNNNRPWMRSVIDGLNYNLDHRERLDTKSAGILAREKIEFLEKFIAQFKKETIDLK